MRDVQRKRYGQTLGKLVKIRRYRQIKPMKKRCKEPEKTMNSLKEKV